MAFPARNGARFLGLPNTTINNGRIFVKWHTETVNADKQPDDTYNDIVINLDDFNNMHEYRDSLLPQERVVAGEIFDPNGQEVDNGTQISSLVNGSSVEHYILGNFTRVHKVNGAYIRNNVRTEFDRTPLLAAIQTVSNVPHGTKPKLRYIEKIDVNNTRLTVPVGIYLDIPKILNDVANRSDITPVSWALKRPEFFGPQDRNGNFGAEIDVGYLVFCNSKVFLDVVTLTIRNTRTGFFIRQIKLERNGITIGSGFPITSIAFANQNVIPLNLTFTSTEGTTMSIGYVKLDDDVRVVDFPTTVNGVNLTITAELSDSIPDSNSIPRIMFKSALVQKNYITNLFNNNLWQFGLTYGELFAGVLTSISNYTLINVFLRDV